MSDIPPRHPMKLLRQAGIHGAEAMKSLKAAADRDYCVLCSELPATEGIYCKRCARGLDDDRYERECGR